MILPETFQWAVWNPHFCQQTSACSFNSVNLKREGKKIVVISRPSSFIFLQFIFDFTSHYFFFDPPHHLFLLSSPFSPPPAPVSFQCVCHLRLPHHPIDVRWMMALVPLAVWYDVWEWESVVEGEGETERWGGGFIALRSRRLMASVGG